MTLNDKLRRILDERGVEWEAFDDFEQTTQWSTYNGAFVYWARERDGKLLVETTAPTKCSASCTPKQAVEITLGPREQTPYEQLQAENAKLRKLLKAVWDDALQFDGFWDYVYDDGTIYSEDELPHYVEKLRELGIEVDV